ncbi:MAG: hypothetical protein DRP47_03385 [Candidatus Zixiibacteriota bacterium]|nr:MAG: hypothetical protein DRP47_03385 [candidate division Zixibacteria bacterium]
MFLTRIIRSFVVCAVLIISIVPVSTYSSDEWGIIGASEWVIEAPTEYPEANAIVIFDRGFTGITKGKDKKWSFSFRRHFRESETGRSLSKDIHHHPTEHNMITTKETNHPEPTFSTAC